MLDTLLSQIGFAIAALVAAFAFLKGDEPERIGAGAFLLGVFATLLLHDRTALTGIQWKVLAVDLVFLGVCAALANDMRPPRLTALPVPRSTVGPGASRAPGP